MRRVDPPKLVNPECLLMCGLACFTGCGWIYATIKRGEIRARYGIAGSAAQDCCISYCCPCCALIQQDNEVQARIASAARDTNPRTDARRVALRL